MGGGAPDHREFDESVFVGNSDVPSRQVLTLSELLPSEVLPSRGSIGHECGVCQPCAFFHKQGCASGAECSFCHLCGPGEKKKTSKGKDCGSARSAQPEHRRQPSPLVTW